MQRTQSPYTISFDAPAGTVAVTLPAATEVSATLSWRVPEEVPAGPLLAGSSGSRLTEERGPGWIQLSGTISAPTGPELSTMLQEVSTELSASATTTEAVLEMSLLRRTGSQRNEWLLLAAETALSEMELEPRREPANEIPGTADPDEPAPEPRLVIGVSGLSRERVSALRDRLESLL